MLTAHKTILEEYLTEFNALALDQKIEMAQEVFSVEDAGGTTWRVCRVATGAIRNYSKISFPDPKRACLSYLDTLHNMCSASGTLPVEFVETLLTALDRTADELEKTQDVMKKLIAVFSKNAGRRNEKTIAHTTH